MNVCIKVKKDVMFPWENGIFFGLVHRVEIFTLDLIWKLIHEFEDMYPCFDAYQCSIYTIQG